MWIRIQSGLCTEIFMFMQCTFSRAENFLTAVKTIMLVHVPHNWKTFLHIIRAATGVRTRAIKSSSVVYGWLRRAFVLPLRMRLVFSLLLAAFVKRPEEPGLTRFA